MYSHKILFLSLFGGGYSKCHNGFTGKFDRIGPSFRLKKPRSPCTKPAKKLSSDPDAAGVMDAIFVNVGEGKAGTIAAFNLLCKCAS